MKLENLDSQTIGLMDFVESNFIFFVSCASWPSICFKIHGD